MQFLVPLSLSALLSPVFADTVGLWRFDEDTATAGGGVVAAVNNANAGTLDAQINGGSPLYSDDVPAAEIYDPVSDLTYPNGFSLDASGANASLVIANDVSFDSSFTVEFFIKVTGEPANYESFLRRREFSDLGWQVDFDHAANQGFGRLRSRWDTPAGAPDNVAEAGVDENVNFVLGPTANATGPKVYVDTGAKDTIGNDVGPQNTGNPADYIYSAVSINTYDTDVALQGDGINDVDEWHHVAVSFDETTGEVKFYFDYLLAQTRTLSDSQGDGYTHPSADIVFGKLSGESYGLLMDELRISDAILTPGRFLRVPGGATGTVTGHWRMEEADAAGGGDIISLENQASVLFAAAPIAGIPRYSTDVPGTTITDPLSGTVYPNGFSLDATGGNARVGVGYDPAFDTSFTLEAFVKLVGEPGGYETFIRRYQVGDLRWQIDFDHAPSGAFGRIRTRWDTPAGEPDNNPQAGFDENVNFVLGPQGGGAIPDDQRIFIDTDLGDGMVASYDDPSDWALDGDGLNDNPEWHHIAMTFDQDTGTIGFYYDYELVQNRTLSDSEADGYTHPTGGLEFGKFSGGEYGILFDEVRYTEGLLNSFEFLQASSAPPAALAITEVTYDPGSNTATVTWNSNPGASYSLFRSDDLSVDPAFWQELLEEEISPEAVTTFEDDTLPPGTTKMFYFVREN